MEVAASGGLKHGSECEPGHYFSYDLKLLPESFWTNRNMIPTST